LRQSGKRCEIGRQGEISVKEAMTRAVATVTAETPIEEADQLLLCYKIEALPVAHRGISSSE
jgi:CBS-domain-containing membrane protein